MSPSNSKDSSLATSINKVKVILDLNDFVDPIEKNEEKTILTFPFFGDSNNNNNNLKVDLHLVEQVLVAILPFFKDRLAVVTSLPALKNSLRNSIILALSTYDFGKNDSGGSPINDEVFMAYQHYVASNTLFMTWLNGNDSDKELIKKWRKRTPKEFKIQAKFAININCPNFEIKFNGNFSRFQNIYIIIQIIIC